jgi:acylphosphatase
MTAKHIIFIGSVHGVGFRYTARSMANNCRLAGFVRNLPDGSVEMLAQGSSEDVDDCINQIERYFGSYIEQTRTKDLPPNPKYTDFRITF